MILIFLFFFFNDPNTYLKNKKISSKLKKKLKKKLKSFKNTTKLWHLAPGTMGQRAHGQARSSPEKQHVEFRRNRVSVDTTT